MRSKRAFLNITTNLILQVVIIIYGFIVPKIIISNYGSSINGLISSITHFLGYIALLDSGFTAVVKSQLYKPIAAKDYRTINDILKSSDKFFKKIAYIFIVYIAILCVAYPLLINNSFDFVFTLLLVIILSISSFSEYYFGMVYKMFLQADQKSYIISLIQIITYIFAIILVIILSKMNVSITILKLITGIIFILRPLLQNLYVKRKYAVNLNGDGNYKIKNKWDGFAQHIAAVIHGGTDVTVLTLFCTLLDVSIYSVYYMVTSGIKKIIQSFTSGIDSSFGDMIAKNEIDQLNDSFSNYEVLYNTIATILYTSTLILIIPFVKVYTLDISDANYIVPLFGYLLVISEYIWVIRQPYNELVKAAGHFKETRVGAWIECILNIIVSVILVIKYGLVGVAIGTIVSILVRAIDYMHHSNKFILYRSGIISVKRVLVMIIETLLIVFISKILPVLDNINYLNWLLNAIMVFIVATIITLSINYLFYKNQFYNIYSMIKKIFRRKKNG